MTRPLTRRWKAFASLHPTLAQMVVFVAVNVGITILQLVLMPLLRLAFGLTALVEVSFQAIPIGAAGPDQYFVFDYPAGALPEGGGGLAYFLAVQVALGVAQVVNFFAQRNITFKSNTNVWWAALWYAIAYVVITFGAAALQGFYRDPVYDLFINVWGWGATGETVADGVTMLTNALISCVVFFPIFKVIFRQKPVLEEQRPDAARVAR